jgi:hypothetical protein
MKRHILAASLALLLASSGLVSAQTVPPTVGGTPPVSGQAGGQQGGQHRAEEFQKHKTEILERISKHLAEVQQRQTCVQAASDFQALKACMPERGERR